MLNAQREMQRAGTALRGGDARAAARACERILTDNPRDLEARYLHGRCLAALGRLDQAEQEFRRVLSSRADHLPALIDLGISLTLAGKHPDARALLERARAIDPRPPAIHFGLGLCLLGMNDAAGAVASLEETLLRDPAFPDAVNNLGVAYDRLGRLADAITAFHRAVQLHPSHGDAQRNLGDALLRSGDAPGAVAALGRAADLLPGDASVRAVLEAAQLAAGEPTRALAVAAELEALGRAGEALALLERAAAGQPGNWELHAAAGTILHRLGSLAEALDHYERALDIHEQITIMLQSGNALESMGAYGRAIATFQKVLAREPANVSAIASLASCGLRLCDWDLTQRMLDELHARPGGIDALQPFMMLATDWQASEVAQSLERRARTARWPKPLSEQGRPEHAIADARLRVAYVSPDFRGHPVGYALAGVIEQHDRSRIEPIAISLQAGDDSPIHARLRDAFETFIDASSLSDREVAQMMRDRDVHIAVDLAGLTLGSRTGIFALRAAPVQVNYLGYPGSMGFDFMDYIVADSLVVPPGEEPWYAEKVLRMPHSYLPFDDSRGVTAFEGGRLAAGLPAQGVVFCGFNNGYKITRAMFEVWMRLLLDVPGSVLWLRSVAAATAMQLKGAAAARGVSSDRLVFAAFEARMDRHLARLALADVFLDTLPYNAHTTASEALWVGVPVVSCAGSSFAGRVGASLLTACGLPELICASLEGYYAQALEIARSSDRRAELRARLLERRAGLPAFDTRRYASDFEDLLFGIDPRGRRSC